jgi:hypothetical protein
MLRNSRVPEAGNSAENKFPRRVTLRKTKCAKYFRQIIEFKK